ncbi:MAG TPA: CvpA family protein [Anaerolineales bacterium]|nr:CvpA family protein [Anaerolineales bacterium]
MMSIIYVLWMYVILFAVIGAMRGWAKELMVSFSVVAALAVNFLLRRYIPIVIDLKEDSTSLFWIRSLILIGLVYFGYQTVVAIPHLASKAARERLQDALFGAFLGAFNGYLIAGTLLFYLSQANYPYPDIVSAPPQGSTLANSVAMLMQYMPPRWLGEPTIYFAVIIILIFIIVVYI